MYYQPIQLLVFLSFPDYREKVYNSLANNKIFFTYFKFDSYSIVKFMFLVKLKTYLLFNDVRFQLSICIEC